MSRKNTVIIWLLKGCLNQNWAEFENWQNLNMHYKRLGFGWVLCTAYTTIRSFSIS